jgi:hypothetical protein
LFLIARQTISKSNRKEKQMKYTAMLLSLTLFVSAGAFEGQALAAEGSLKRLKVVAYFPFDRQDSITLYSDRQK